MLLVVTNAIYGHLSRLVLLVHVDSNGKWSEIQRPCTFRRGTENYDDKGTSGLVLDCGGTFSFTANSSFLGSLIHRDLMDTQDAGRPNKGSFPGLRRPARRNLQLYQHTRAQGWGSG